MNFEDLITKYPNREVAFPANQPTPNKEDLDSVIRLYDCKFPESFIKFQMEYCHQVSMGDFAWEGFGWANRSLDAYMNLEEVVKDYREMDYPKYLTPFKQENGDFWCFDTRQLNEGEFPVVIRDHNNMDIVEDQNYQWKNFIDWLDSTMEEEY